jgi:hypothetical protein
LKLSALLSLCLCSGAFAQAFDGGEAEVAAPAALPADAPVAEPPTNESTPPMKALGVAPGISPLPNTSDVLNRPVPPVPSFLIPLVETQIFNLAFLAFSNLVSRESFAQVSADSIASHFDGRRHWEWDVDIFVTNQFGHPYQGALAFTAARSSGLSFWWAALYPTLSSLTWEMFYEVDAPSFNDLITTPVGGVFLGEVLHRAARLLLTHRRPGPPGWAERIGALLLEPAGAMNRGLFAGELERDDVEENPPYFAMVGGGANFGAAFRNENTGEIVRESTVQANVQGRFTYGIPGDPSFRYASPFSHFDLDFNVSAPYKPITSFFIRGLVAGKQWGDGNTRVRGLWGLFGQYDFAFADLVRVSSVSAGLGTSLQWRVADNTFLQVSGVLGFMPFASGGQSSSFDDDETGAPARNYHIGFGGQGTLELRLIQRGIGWLRIAARSWFILGRYIEPLGWESLNYITVGPLVHVWGPLALGGDIVGAFRLSTFQDQTFNNSFSGATYRLTLNWLSSNDMGAVAPTVPGQR